MVWGESQNAGIQQTNLKTGERGRVNKPTWNERYRMWEDSIAIVRGDPLKAVTPDVQRKIDAYKAIQKKDRPISRSDTTGNRRTSSRRTTHRSSTSAAAEF